VTKRTNLLFGELSAIWALVASNRDLVLRSTETRVISACFFRGGSLSGRKDICQEDQTSLIAEDGGFELMGALSVW